MVDGVDEDWLRECIGVESDVLRRLQHIRRDKQALHESSASGAHSSTTSPSLDTAERVETELSWSHTQLVWRRGSVTVRTFTFDDAILAATWSCFPPPSAKTDFPELRDGSKGKTKDTVLSRALCVLFKHKLHLLFIASGDSFDVPLAFTARSLWAAKQGVVIQRQLEAEDLRLQRQGPLFESAGQDQLPTVFHLKHALEDIGGVYRAEQISCSAAGLAAIHGLTRPFADPDERILLVSDGSEEPPLLVTHSANLGALNVYSYSLDDLEPRRVLLPVDHATETARSEAEPVVQPFAPMQRAFSTIEESQLSLADGSQHEPAAAEASALDASQWSRQPPRKSARLEHDRKLKYYGSLAGDDALDRSRRVNWLQGSELRMSSAGESLGGTAMDRAASLDILQPDDLAQLADGIARQSHGDAIMEDGTRLSLAGRPSLGPRQASGRLSSRPIVSLSGRNGRQSSAMSRQSSSAIGEPNVSLHINLDPPAPVAAPGEPPQTGRAYLLPEDLHETARSYAHVALLGRIDCSAASGVRLQCNDDGSLLIWTDGSSELARSIKLITRQDRSTEWQMEKLSFPPSKRAALRTQKSPLASLCLEALRAMSIDTDIREAWHAARDRARVSPDERSSDWATFCQVLAGPSPEEHGANGRERSLAKVLGRAAAHGGGCLPSLVDTVSWTPEPRNMSADQQAHARGALTALHILGQELSLDLVLRAQHLPKLAQLLIRLGDSLGESHFVAYWQCLAAGDRSFDRKLDYVSYARRPQLMNQDPFAAWCASLGLDNAAIAHFKVLCWRCEMVSESVSKRESVRDSLVQRLSQSAKRRLPIDLLRLTSPEEYRSQRKPRHPSGLSFDLRFAEEDVRSLPQSETVQLPLICAQLFPSDSTLQEVASMLDTSKAQSVRLGKRDGVEETKSSEMFKVKGAVNRIKATSVGRGMFLMRSAPFSPTKAWHVPALVVELRTTAGEKLTPNAALRDAVEMEWPDFHNGVASALQMIHDGPALDSHWLFNGQGVAPNATHAGFLLGTGLLDKIAGLGRVHAWRYLINRHNLTSVGIILGLAATFVGTRDRVAFTLLSIQLPSFLPAGSTSLNIPFQTQAAGLLGVGLIFLGSNQRSKVATLLRDLVPPEPESRDVQADYREGHALAAGFAIGLIMLGRAQHDSMESQADQDIVTSLFSLVSGEGIDSTTDSMERLHNMGVTSIPATMALALIFLRSNRKDIAARIPLPTSAQTIDLLRPDFLLFRVLARALIMWDDIRDDMHWIEDQLPDFVPRDMPQTGRLTPRDEALELARINMHAGLALAVGLKYAGAGALSPAARMLRRQVDWLWSSANVKAHGYFEKVRLNALQAALDVVALAAAMVQAGEGDVHLLSQLRARHHNMNLNYGNQMATHMALGMLFLGGGRFSLGTSDKAIACLLIACLPRFPSASTDNRAHLQAFRHLWLLAVEPRLVIARDVDTHRSESKPVGEWKEQQSSKARSLTLPRLKPSEEAVMQPRWSINGEEIKLKDGADFTIIDFKSDFQIADAGGHNRTACEPSILDTAVQTSLLAPLAENLSALRNYKPANTPDSTRAIHRFFTPGERLEQYPASAVVQGSVRALACEDERELEDLLQAQCRLASRKYVPAPPVADGIKAAAASLKAMTVENESEAASARKARDSIGSVPPHALGPELRQQAEQLAAGGPDRAGSINAALSLAAELARLCSS